MKRLVITVAIATLLTSVMAGASFAKRAVSKDDPAKVITEYFNAEKTSNYELMDEYGTDIRFSNFNELKTFYSEIAGDHPLLDYKIVSSNQIDESHIEFLVETTYKGQDQVGALPYTVVKENGEWTVLIEPAEIDMNESSPDYRKAKKSTKKLDTSNFATAAVTSREYLLPLVFGFHGHWFQLVHYEQKYIYFDSY